MQDTAQELVHEGHSDKYVDVKFIYNTKSFWYFQICDTNEQKHDFLEL